MNYYEVKIYTTSEGIEPLSALLIMLGQETFVTEDKSVLDEFLEKKNVFDWDYVDPETGETIPEGTRIRFSLLCAPDYYINDDGSVRWDDLGKGASLSYEFTVDNTAPKLVGSQPLTLSADGKTLYYTAQDENYVAAVVLMNGSASKAVSYSYPDMPLSQKGKAVSGSLDLASYAETNGNKAVIAVCDYAGNETYYVINLNGSHLRGLRQRLRRGGSQFPRGTYRRLLLRPGSPSPRAHRPGAS